MRDCLAFESIFGTDNTLAPSERFKTGIIELGALELTLEEHDMNKENRKMTFFILFRGGLTSTDTQPRAFNVEEYP